MSMKLSAIGNGAREEHDGGGARKCIHGYICQVNLCALNFLRAFRSGYTFHLGSEDKEIKDFDDMILKYEHQGRQKKLFFQSKHIQNCENKALTASYLLWGKNEKKWKDEKFLLSKYYESYLKNGIESEEHYFIIYTNMGLDIEDLKKEGINVEPQSPELTSCFFQIKSDKNTDCYKLSIIESHSLFEKLYTLSDAYKVAQELVKCIKEEKTLGMTNDVLKKYKGFLRTKVIVGSTDGEKIRQFDNEFISGKTLSSNFKTFRNIFKKLYYEVMKPPYEFHQEDDFQNELRTKRINVSNSFLELNDKIIEFQDPSECIKRFFKELVLAVNQPNETELEEIIKKEIKEIFNINDTALIVPLIKSKILDWMKERIGTWLTKEDAEWFIQGVKENMKALMIRGISLDYQNELNRMCCIIIPQELEDDSVVQEVGDFLLSKCETMLIRSEESLLSLLKVFQGIMLMKELDDFECLKNDDDFLLLSFSCLVSSRALLNDLKNINTFNLLVIYVQEKNLNDDSFQECLKDLLNLAVSKNRKLILIFQEDVTDVIVRYICEDEQVVRNSKIVLDKPLSFSQLDEVAQDRLLQLKVVDFQGNLTNFASLSSEIKNVIDAKTLRCLVQQENIHVGMSVEELSFNDSYIPRRLCLDESHISTVSNDASMPTIISEDDLLSNELDKVLVISGEPRCGKSFLLSNLAMKLKMKYPSMWVLKLDFNNYTEICSNMGSYTTQDEQYTYADDAEKTFEFIIEKILQVTTSFEKELLKLGFLGHIRLSLLIDGFSELCQDGCRFALQLIRGMQKTEIMKLIITTRPEKIKHLKCLQGKYFSLETLVPNETIKQVRLNSTIRLPDGLDEKYQSIVNTGLKILGNRDKTRITREISRATDGHYDSVSNLPDLINAVSYFINVKGNVTYRLE